MFSMMEDVFTVGQLNYLEGPDRTWHGMDLPTSALFDAIIAES